MDLENLFCQIDTNNFNVHDGRSTQVVTIYRPTVTQEKRGDNSINKAIRESRQDCSFCLHGFTRQKWAVHADGIAMANAVNDV